MSKSPFISLFKQSIIYGIGQAFLSLSAFLLMPIFTNPYYLSVENYGIWQVLNVTMVVLVNILGLGMATTLFRFYYTENDRDAKAIVGSTIFGALVFFSLLFYLFTIFIIHPLILDNLTINSIVLKYIDWIVLGAVLQVLSIVPLNILRAEERPWQYITFQVIQFILLITTLLVFLVYFNWQLAGMVWGYIIAFAGNFLFLMLSYIKKIHWKLNIPLLKKMLRFGLPLIVLQLGGWVLTVFDRYIITSYFGYEATAIYSAGYQLGSIINLAIITPFSIAWGPFMFKVFNLSDAKIIYARTLTYITFISLYVAMVITVFSNELLNVFTQSTIYFQARPIITLVSMGYVFYGMYFVYTSGLNITNKTYYFPGIIIVASVFNIVANFLLTPHWGIQAAAVITIISYALLAFLTCLFSQKHYYIQFEYGRIGLLFGIFTIFSLIGYNWQPKSLIASISIKMLILLAPFGLLNLFKFFTKQEINFVKVKLDELLNG